MDKAQNKKTVLVADDNPINMKLAVELLRLNGFDVVQCTDGDGVLEALSQGRPDLILLDIGMPGMDGFEIHKRVRADDRFAGVKIAAFSAFAMKEDEERIRAAGFDAFIAKPIDIKNFVKRIRELL